jgi:omega-amidase
MTLIALAQVVHGSCSRAATLKRATRMVEEAARGGASLICFPEQFLTGWCPNVPNESGESLEGRSVAAFRKMAQQNGIAVVGSFVERSNGRPKNTAVALDACGELLATYAKIHLFSPAGEEGYYSPGDRTATFTIDGVRFGLSICYDLRFPELFRIYGLIGAECVLVPAAWPCCRMHHWEILLAARALENQYYVAGVNTPGAPDGAYCGGSLVSGPDGDVLGRCGTGEEVLTVSLDLKAVREARRRIPSLSDRRGDLYQTLLSNL